MSKILGIDVGGTYTRYGYIDGDLVYGVKKISTSEIDDFPVFVKKQVDKYSDIEIVSIGIPGAVSNNKIVSVPNVKSLENENLSQKISHLTKTKVIINRDVYLLFLHDINVLNLGNKNNILGFYLGTGLGNVIRIDGKIFHGNNGLAAEVGHIPIIGNNRVCTCGKKGCTETIVSGKFLIEIFKEEKLSGNFVDVFINHLHNTKIVKFIDDFVRIIAMEVIIFDITTIIVGGGVVNMRDFPKKNVVEKLRNYLEIYHTNELEIYFVNDVPNAGIIGASLIINEGE